MKITAAILLGLGFIFGLLLCNLFHSENKAPSAPRRTTAAALQNSEQVQYKTYESQRADLDNRNAKLAASAKQARLLSSAAQSKSRALADNIVRSTASLSQSPDTTCIEVVGHLNELLSLSAYQDSLHYATEDALSLQLLNRDAALHLADTRIATLKALTDTALNENYSLVSELTLIKKRYRRKQIGNKLRSVSLVIITVFAVNSFLK